MTVSKFTQPDYTTQTPVTYKNNLDAAIAVSARNSAGFAPRAEDTPSMKIAVDAGVLFDRSTGGYFTQAAQATSNISAPGSNSKIVRVYVDEIGLIGTVEGATSNAPVAPSYPVGTFPVCQVTVANSTTSIINSMITDERAWNVGYGTPRNTVLIETTGNFICPIGANFLRATLAAGGGGGGGGCSGASDTTKFGGGGGSGGTVNVGRLLAPENLTCNIGAGGLGGHSATVMNSTTGRTAATSGGNTSITGVITAFTISCAAGILGNPATTTANGTGGAAPAAGTGIAGTAGATGVSNTNGGNGGGTGTGGIMSRGGAGAILASTRTGSPGTKGSGGGGAIGYTPSGSDVGGDGGAGFVLIEVF